MTFKELEEISKKDLGSKVWCEGEIIFVKQTSGPTLLTITDGKRNFTLKAFKAPGERAYPEINIGDFVKVFIQINERNGGIEGEVLNMEALSISEKESFKVRLDKLKESQTLPQVKNFSIQSPVLESLKTNFIEVTKLIRKAIFEGRPIILRHDADCDGYSSAIAIERAILKLMREVSQDQSLQFQLYRRAPCRTPFYDYEDAVKDLSIWLKDRAKMNVLPPLIIITDNGSTREDILAFRQMKVYDCQIVVIDHHFPGEIDKNGKVEVDYIIDAHINPYLKGFDSNVCSGMLGFELAKMIYKNNSNSYLIPAMAGLLDHTSGNEKEKYIELAKNEGFEIEYMENLGEIIYLLSHYLRFNEAREFFDEIFDTNKNLQNSLVKILTPEIKKRYEKVEIIGKTYSKVEDFGKFFLVSFDGEKGCARGQFPAIGKSTNRIHKMFEDELEKPIITAVSGSTFLTIRVSDEIKNFSVPKFCVNWIDKKIPHTKAEGGGHEHAGSIKFVEYAKNEVVNLFKEYLMDVGKKQ